MQHGFKPFSPYGQLLHDLRSAQPNLNYAPYVFCGRFAIAEARKMLASGLICLALPPNTKVSDYRWSVAGLPLILFDSGEISARELKKIAYALLKEKAKQVCVYFTNPPGVDIFNLQ